MFDTDFDIQLQDKQLEAFQSLEESPIQYLGYGGAKFGGKSYLIRASQIIRRLKYAGTVGAIFRESYPVLLANHIRKIFREFPKVNEWYKASDKSIYYPNGSVTDFRHIENLDDAYKYMGIEYDDITIDQAEQHEEEVFKILKMSLRHDPLVARQHPTFRPKCLLTFNPGGIGHGWIKRIFIDREFEEQETPEDYGFIQAKYYDNPIGVDANPGYLKNLMDLPEDLRKAYIDGDFDIFSGQVFRKLREDKHLIEPFVIPDKWLKFRSLDWGYEHDAVCLWWAVSPERDVYIYRGYKENERVVTNLATEILNLTPKSERVGQTFASQDLWQRVRTDEALTDTTMADLMIDRGLYIEQAIQDRVMGWNILMEYLEWDKENRPKPKLKIFKNYKWIFDDLRKLIYDPKKPEDVKKMKGDDTGDAARYGIMHIYEQKEMGVITPKSQVELLIDKITRSRKLGSIISGEDDY